MKNEDMEFFLSCSSQELLQLKAAVRDQMASPQYAGHALLGQKMNDFDPEHVHRKKLWSLVTAKNKRFEEMLSGTRLKKRNVPDLGKGIAEAKTFIIQDLNNRARNAPYKKRARDGDSTVDHVDPRRADSDDDSVGSAIPATTRKLRSQPPASPASAKATPTSKGAGSSAATSGQKPAKRPTLSDIRMEGGGTQRPQDTSPGQSTVAPNPVTTVSTEEQRAKAQRIAQEAKAHHANSKSQDASVGSPLRTQPNPSGDKQEVIQETRAGQPAPRTPLPAQQGGINADRATKPSAEIEKRKAESGNQAQQTTFGLAKNIQAMVKQEIASASETTYRKIGIAFPGAVEKQLERRRPAWEAKVQEMVNSKMQQRENELTKRIETRMQQREDELASKIEARIMKKLSEEFNGGVLE